MIKKTFQSPPGGLVIWIIVLAELITFGMFFATFAFHRANELILFNESQLLLNSTLATINTVVLLSSSWLVVMGLIDLKSGKNKAAKRWYLFAAILGVVFLIIKLMEYHQKMEAGINMSTNTFFSYYWLLTILHFFHVVIGVVILFYISNEIAKGKYNAANFFDVEGASIYWHLCDLLWIILFPLLYIMH